MAKDARGEDTLKMVDKAYTITTPAGQETVLPPLFVNNLSFRTTKYRRAAHTLELDYEFHPRFSAHIGHRYSDRHIELFHLDQTVGADTVEGCEHAAEMRKIRLLLDSLL